MTIDEGELFQKVAIRRERGAHLSVCENTLNFCPYCGSKKIKEVGKRGADSHLITCERCYGLFSIPCED